MIIKAALLILAGFSVLKPVHAQTRFTGTVTTKLGQTIQGEIAVNLQGENDDQITVTSTVISKSKGARRTSTSSSKLNVAVIKHISVTGETFYFRDIKIGYNDSMLKNVCVRLVYGTLDCGLFESGDGKSEHSVAVKFPKAPLSELASVDFDYYHTSASVAMRLSGCPALQQKMADGDETITWAESNSREQRIERFKNIIREYNVCTSH